MKMRRFFILKLVFLVYLTCLAKSEENEEVDSSSSIAETIPTTEIPTTIDQESSSMPSISPSSSVAVVTTDYQPVSTNICNMSLITSIEDETVLYKTCKCDGFHGDVDCSHLGITQLPSLISFPKAISMVNFQGNKISDLKSDTFHNAREVIEMDLSYNKIDFISITAFKAFKKLIRLNLSHNRVWNLPKDMFQGLGDLRRLDLSFNDLLSVSPGHFSQLKELRELIMKDNPLKELEPKHFEHLEKLEILDLESTLLKVIPDHVFAFTRKLKVLKLGSNQLTSVPTEALHYLHHLKVLDLSGNPIEVIYQQAFHGLSGLVNLHLDRMPKLSRIENYAFGDMEHLQELHCSYNYMLYDISPHAFVKKLDNNKVSLSQLFLRQNELRSLPENLQNWNPSMELHLRDNPLHCDCQANWMINIKLKNDFQSHARCASPAEHENDVLSKLKGLELKCGLQLADIVLVICGVFMGLLVLVLIVSFFVWRRNYRGYSKPGFYTVKNRHVNDIDYTGGGDDSF